MAGRSRILIALTALFVVFALVPIWWWALLGMSKDVASAWVVTDVALGIVVMSWWGSEVL